MKRHYTSLYFLFFSILFFPLILKGIEPVGEVRCEPGGEFGNIVTFKLSKDFRYGKLTVKRTLAGSDLTKDIGAFVGGDYRLDIATKGGITGYSLEYAAKDPAAALATTEGTLSCAVSTTPETTSAPEPPPVPVVPTIPSAPSPPVSSPEPAPQAPVAPVTAPTETPTTPSSISVEAGRIPPSSASPSSPTTTDTLPIPSSVTPSAEPSTSPQPAPPPPVQEPDLQ